MTIVNKNSWTGAFYRWMRGENRTALVSHLESTFEQTKNMLEKYASSQYLIELLLAYMKRAESGLRNLLVTYDTSPATKIRLQVLLSSIQLQFHSVDQRSLPEQQSSISVDQRTGRATSFPMQARHSPENDDMAPHEDGVFDTTGRQHLPFGSSFSSVSSGSPLSTSFPPDIDHGNQRQQRRNSRRDSS